MRQQHVVFVIIADADLAAIGCVEHSGAVVEHERGLGPSEAGRPALSSITTRRKPVELEVKWSCIRPLDCSVEGTDLRRWVQRSCAQICGRWSGRVGGLLDAAVSLKKSRDELAV